MKKNVFPDQKPHLKIATFFQSLNFLKNIISNRACLIFQISLIVFMFQGNLADAATYYVRTDGGTSTQCTGTTDAPYPGSGSGKLCAFNHPFWVLSPAGSPSKMQGGDTLIIGPGQYMMGLNAPNTPSCSFSFPWDCRMRSVPSGTAAKPTKILGKGWDSGCANRPQLWGTERTATLIDLTSSNYVQVQCLDITDHSSCMDSGPDKSTRCNRDQYPYGPWALIGVSASDSANVLLKNVKIHGLRTGILAGRLKDWTLENTDIIANSFVGWDGDIGAGTSSNSGTMSFINSRIMWNGCGETYPGLQPHNCYSQDQGGYGDGLGTNRTGGNWIFRNSDISYNVSDGLDLLYHNGSGVVTISRSRFEGNAGNQVKTATRTVIDNSKLIGNCAFFKGRSLTATTGIGFSPVAFNHCRAGGSALSMEFKPGMVAEIYNSTVTGNGDVMVLSSGSSCQSSEKVISKNNIYLGGIEYHNGVDRADLYYASGAGGNGDGPCGKIPFVSSNDIIWGTKYNSIECKGNTSKCVDPKLVGPVSATGQNINVSLQSTSPAINAGTVLSNLGLTDFNNFSRGSRWDIGAVEYGSIETKPSTTSSSSGSNTNVQTTTPVCGNGKIESSEQCDRGSLGGKTCQQLGFAGGVLGCSSNCTFSTSSCNKSVCGNGIVEGAEQCDKSNIAGKTCSALGFSSGTLGCDASCKFNTLKCQKGSVCGNKQVEPGEDCEDNYTLDGQTCRSLGYSGGNLGCLNCKFNISACEQSVCGNKIVEQGEQCEDNYTLAGQTCRSLGYAGGNLGCFNCKFNISACEQNVCGNKIVEQGEQCEDNYTLAGQSCRSLGYASGNLGCYNCKFNTSPCTASVCGNGILEPGEQCDSRNLSGQTCSRLGYRTGTLLCSKSCRFVTSLCLR